MGGEKGKLIDKGTSPPRIHFASAHRSLIYGFGRCFGNFYAFALFFFILFYIYGLFHVNVIRINYQL